MTTSVSLRNLIDSARRLDELDAARVIANAAELVHKQQKGGQPLHTLTPDVIVVSDAGDATLVPSSAASSPAYTSPERLRGEAGDRRSDVFALGAILWEALAHEPHFEGEIDGEIKAAILEGEYRSTADVNANVPAELDAICRKALSRSPADRYPSCKVMAAEIATVLDDAGYADDNTALAAHVTSKYVPPTPKLAKVPTSRDTPVPGTPILPAPLAATSPTASPAAAPLDLAKSSPTQTLQGVAPRKELDEALAKQAAAATAAATQSAATNGASSSAATSTAATSSATTSTAATSTAATSTAATSTAATSTAAPSSAGAPRAKSPSSQPIKTPADASHATSPTSQPVGTSVGVPAEAPRAKSPSSQPVGAASSSLSPTSIANAARSKSPSSQPGGPSILDAVPPRTKSPSQQPVGSQTMPGVPPLTVTPAASSPTVAAAKPDAPTLLNTPAPIAAATDTATATSTPTATTAPKSFSKTAVLGSLSSADLALPPVEDAGAVASGSSASAVPIGRKTEVHGSASLADKLAAINQGTDAAQPGGVVMLGLPAVPPGADPSSFKTPLPGTLPPAATLPPASNITTAETVATPALAGYAAAEAKAAAALDAVQQPPDARVVTPGPSQALQMAAAATAVSSTDSLPPTDSMTPVETTPGVHPASVVALPRPRSASEGGGARRDPTHSGEKRDPLAGWGWGTGPHETIAADDDDFYDTHKSSKKRLVYAIGGAAAAVLLVVVAAFAFGGGNKDEKKADVAAKQTEPAVDWSQPTEPPPAPAPAVDPNVGSGSALAVDPNAGSGSAAIEPGIGSGSGSAVEAGSAAPVDPNAGSSASPLANGSGSSVAAVPVPVPPAAVDTAPVKPEPIVEPKKEPVVETKVEPKKVEPKKVEPKKVEPKKVEPKKVATKVEPKQKKLPPPQPVTKTKNGGSWDPLAAPAKPLKPSGPIDPYANDAPAPKKADPNAAYKTGIQQFARGDSSGALSTFKTSLAANPDFAPTWRGIGMVYEKLGKRSQAKTAFKRYLTLSPSAGDAESIRERMERL